MIEIATGDFSSASVYGWECFPLTIGRGNAAYVLDGAGVWDCHVVLSRDLEGWIVATPQGEAAVFRGEDRIGSATRIRNGDRLELGSIRLQFRITNCRQRTLGGLEGLAWIGILGLASIQLFLLFLI